jgi:pyruvate dehydrogenase E1 component alpha subunit
MTPAEEQHHVEGFEARGEVYDMPAETVDGMSVDSVYKSTKDAVERARAGEGPSLLICETYRYRGHYEGDPMAYRTEEELEEWQQRDPIDTLEASLLESDAVEASEIEAMYETASERIDEAVEFARDSDYPDPETAFEDVYTEEI